MFSMTNDLVEIVYPRGGGGSWLNNLIFNLENNQKTISKNLLVFDNEPKSSIRISHEFEVEHDKVVSRPTVAQHVKYFSTACVFNLYVNNISKIYYNPQIFNFQSLPWLDQFFKLTDHAVYMISDPIYVDTYCKKIDLDYQWLFHDPKLFVSTLFDILDLSKISYNKDCEYVLQSIDNYKSTCQNPDTIFDNWKDLSWLSWCHAMATINQWPLDQQLDQAHSLEQVAESLRSHRDKILQNTDPLIFWWNTCD